MSVLGDFVRLSPALLAEIGADPLTAPFRLLDGYGSPGRLALDWEWRPFAGLFDAVGFPLNPVSSGALFPDAEHAFGAEGDSHVLMVHEVVRAADLLVRTPFDMLAPHLHHVLEEQAIQTVDYDLESPTFEQKLPPERWIRPEISDEEVEMRRGQLAARYPELVAFFRAAAGNGECTVFWAA